MNEIINETAQLIYKLQLKNVKGIIQQLSDSVLFKKTFLTEIIF